MDTAGPLLVVARSRHIPITDTTINNEEHFRSDLSAQEASFIVANFLPLGEVLGYFRVFDTRRCLAVASVHIMRRM